MTFCSTLPNFRITIFCDKENILSALKHESRFNVPSVKLLLLIITEYFLLHMFEVIAATTISSDVLLFSSFEITRTGRFLLDVKSENGSDISSISPCLYIIPFLIIYVIEPEVQTAFTCS